MVLKKYKFSSFIKFFVSLFIVLFIIGFSSKELSNPATGWNMQVVEGIGARYITDIYFIDSLTGFLIGNGGETKSRLFKTTNGGNNWILNYELDSIIPYEDSFSKIKFLNKDTGVALCGFSIRRTTNQGLNWTVYDFHGYDYNFYDFQMFGNDTIWISGSNVYNGKIFFSTNGGQNLQQKFTGNNWELKHIYLFNRNIGYCSDEDLKIYKTTDGGNNWSLYLNEGMNQIYFIDSLTGWRCYSFMKKTTDGGATWFEQQLPRTNMSNWYGMLRFSVLNKDTIWGVGGLINFYYPSGYRGIIYKTTNGGLNWGYQLPDTSINLIYQPYYFCYFKDSKHGWCYSKFVGGVHTKVGGSDTTFYTNIKEQITNITSDFILYQNYPNPFNQSTIINIQLSIPGYIKLDVYDISGKHIKTIVDKKQNAGNYEYIFNGSNLSSGIYFYRIHILDKGGKMYSETKRMILIK